MSAPSHEARKRRALDGIHAGPRRVIRHDGHRVEGRLFIIGVTELLFY